MTKIKNPNYEIVPSGVSLNDWIAKTYFYTKGEPPARIYVNYYGLRTAFGGVNKAIDYAIHAIYTPTSKKPKEIARQSYLIVLAWGGEDKKTRTLDVVGGKVPALTEEEWKENPEYNFWNYENGIWKPGKLCGKGVILVAAEEKVRLRSVSRAHFMTRKLLLSAA